MPTPLSTADILLLSHRLSPLAFEVVSHLAGTLVRPTHEDMVMALHRMHEAIGDDGDDRDACEEAIRVIGGMPDHWHEGELRADQFCDFCEAGVA